jgi:DNA polymerase-1
LSTGRHLYLVDGSGFIFRAYHALPPLTRSDGTPVGAVLGFCNMLYKLLQDSRDGDKPTHLAVIFDSARLTFRNDIYPEYKANRPAPPEDLVPQFGLIRDAVRAFNVPCIEMPGFEADDIIATYAKDAARKGDIVTIVSSDKDLMQLVDETVSLYDTMKEKRIGREGVFERFGVPPEKVVEVQALAGDSTDNVPGIPGIGVKTAAELITEYGDLETLLTRAGEVKQAKRRERLIEFAGMARVSRRLVLLRDDVPVSEPLDDLHVRDPQAETLLAFLKEMEFRTLATKVAARLEALGQKEGIPPTAAALPATPGEVRYVTVTEMAELQSVIAQAEAQGFVAVDTESTDLNCMRARLVGISLSVKPGEGYYIPLAHGTDGLDLDGAAPRQLPLNDVIEALIPLMADPSVLKIGQNLKYDMLLLKRYGVTFAGIDDTMLISYALEAGIRGHGLDEMAQTLLDLKLISFKDVAGTGKNRITFDKVSIETATRYAAEDADIALRLHQLLKPQLVGKSAAAVYERLERRMPEVLVRMEHHGIEIDRAALARLSADFAQAMARLEDEIHTLAGHKFNIASPKQLGEVLFDKLNLGNGKKGKTGAYATGADILESLAAEGHALPAKVLEWRQVAKLKNTYTDTLPNEINAETGRVHTSYALAATTTGRLSSSDPNLQNIPIRTEEGRKIRQAFIAPKGSVLMSADYSQIELRLLAHYANIEALKSAFHQGLDIHAMTASEVFGVPLAQMDPQTRRRAKAINFGIIYGISPFGLANQLGIAQSEARQYIDSYFARFPGIRAYMEETKQFCRENGYVRTLFGRRCHMPMINEKVPARRAFAERAAINAPLQGTAADIIRRAMIRLHDALEASNLATRMLLQVHDELVFEVLEEEVEETRRLVTSVMEGAASPAISLSVPLVVEAKTGRNWDEAH